MDENKPDDILDDDIEQEEEETLEEDDQEEEEETLEEDDSEPPVRKTADYWQSEKEKLEAKKARAEYFKAKKGREEDDDPSRKVIQEEIQRALEPVTKLFKSQADEKEMQDVFSKYPEAKKFESAIRKYASNPAYSQVPIDFIARGIIADRESKKNSADEEARGTRLGGHSRRPQKADSLPDFSKMTDAEMQEYERKARQGN